MNRGRLVVVLVVLLGLSTGCSRPLDLTVSPAPQASVAMIVKLKQSEYWSSVVMGAEAAAKEFHVELRLDGPDLEGDIARQIELLRRAVDGGAGAVVLAPGGYEGIDGAVEQATARGVPVVTIDTEVRSPKVKGHIGIDHADAGRKAAGKLAELVGERARVAIVRFSPEDRNADLRVQGLLEELSARHPHIRVVSEEHCSSVARLCGEVTRKLLRSGEGLDGIVALNADASLAVARELVSLGADGRVKLVAFDNAPEAVELLQDGVIHAMIIQNPFSMGYLGVKQAVDAMAGRKVPDRTATEIKVIDLNNMLWTDNQKLLFPFVK